MTIFWHFLELVPWSDFPSLECTILDYGMFLFHHSAGVWVVQEREGCELDPVAQGPGLLLEEDQSLPGDRLLPLLLDTAQLGDTARHS